MLLVEEDPQVRALLQRSLSARGHRVVAVKDATEALAAWGEDKRTFDVLLTDVLEPGVRGPDLADRLRSDPPSLRVLYMSGHTDGMKLAPERAEGRWAVVTKPVPIELLMRKVDELLGMPPVLPQDPVGKSPA